jgi:predicted exporter
MDKVNQINENLTRLSLTALALVGVAFVLVFAVLFFIYGFSGAFSIMRIPVCASCLAVALFGYLGVPFNFFATVGIILTLGIGIDYSLFFKEGRGSPLTVLAIALSALTTILSFGSLSFSGFSPVSTFGLSVFLGILFNFILSPFAGSRGK